MARIRSLHPGQWTDEDFVSCSAFARLLALGLRNEADDNGVFEWKPVGLKMRLFPVDNLDIVALLAELVEHDQIKQYEIKGKKYGVIRNFGKYQRPKKPNHVHPMPDEFRIYAALNVSSSELGDDEAHSIPQKSEIASQMKEEGGKGKGSRVSNETLSPSGESESEWLLAFIEAYPKSEGKHAAKAEWDAALAAGAAPQSILDGLKHAKTAWKKAHGDETRFVPKAAKWLHDKGWLDHNVISPTAIAPTWNGPDDIREGVVSEKGDNFTRTTLDLAVWHPPKTILARTETAAERLSRLACLKPYIIKRQDGKAA